MVSDSITNILVLAGTGEARAVIGRLADDPNLRVTASLAGATTSPKPLPVPVITGGFGGAEGLASFCLEHQIDILVDITHPFARHISRNADLAAGLANIPCIRYERPAWEIEPGWRSFDDWDSMVAAIPTEARVFLAGGTAAITAFAMRDDIYLWARALNVGECENSERVTYLNAMPHTSVADELALFTDAGITHLCCKNSGGDASRAKIDAARQLGIPVWMLGRYRRENDVQETNIYDNLEQIVAAISQLQN